MVGAVCMGTIEEVVLVWWFLGRGLLRVGRAKASRARRVPAVCIVAGSWEDPA